ncbi:MAG TPA: MBL fold metallo-hydrolase [Patescibacteria group bacterium]|nr:MBL fold metallo-hydrolase [Patescibacteria group bacterium]
MKIEFFGACQTVTGSQYVITVGGKKLLLDCGFWQGRRKDMEKINREFPFDPKSIDAMILSHAHIDHSGNIPNLVKQGFAGKIYCTEATKQITQLMLEDSARVQVYDVEYLNKKLSAGAELLEPIYTLEDVAPAMKYFVGLNYHQEFEPLAGVKAYFRDAGHVLGSALTTLELVENGQIIRLGFTGDLGRKFLPILRDPEQIRAVDYLVAESTYGDRLHDTVATSYLDLAKAINETYARGGKVIIPSFALERAQELLYIIHELINQKAIPPLFVYLDSPLTERVSEVFSEYPELLDEETQKTFLERGKDPFIFTTLRFVETPEESKKLNNIKQPCIIISASGMCEFGRIRHHLKNSIADKNNTVVIVGFMAENTLGRKLLDGAKEVNILNETLPVKAKIVVLNSLSAHADQYDLVKFIQNVGKLKKLFLVHGEAQAMTALTEKLIDAQIGEIVVPEKGYSSNL